MAISQVTYFPTIRIKGFKSIDDLSISSLARINLIAGDNNVGKSTLLEALYVFATDGDIKVMAQIACDRMGYPWKVDLRQDEKTRQLLMLSFFKDWKFELGKLIFFQTADNRTLELRAVCAYAKEEKTESGKIYRVTNYITDENQLGEVVGEVKKGIYRKSQIDDFYPLDGEAYYFDDEYWDNVQFIHTSSFSKSLNVRLWNNIALTGLEKYVIEALRIIEPDVENLAFLEETFRVDYSKQQTRVPYVTLREYSGRFPLNVMGDGMNRILSLVLGIVNSANGICLIDEIENGIYYRRQPELWKMIGMLAEQLNVQVFVTTHSLDCIRSFADMAEKQDAQLIRLERRTKGIKAVCYSGEELRVAMNNDMELR